MRESAPGEGPGPSSQPSARGGAPGVSRLRLRTALAVPVATIIALATHLSIATKQPVMETHSYTWFLGLILCAAIVALAVQPFWPGLRRWMSGMLPIIAAVMLMLCLWEVITTGLRLLPLPYFPGPAGVLQSLVSDRQMLADS